MEQQALKGFEGCEKDSPKKPEIPPFKFIEVEVCRKQYSMVYLKVPQDFDNKTIYRDPDILRGACKETLESFDWDDYGWEYDLECESVKEITEEETAGYELYEVKA